MTQMKHPRYSGMLHEESPDCRGFGCTPVNQLVHNHGPNRGRGLDCPEHTINGRLVGACLASEPFDEPAEETLGMPVETRITSPTGGQKGQKLARFDLIPAEAMWKVAEVYGHGSEKYEDNNWRKGYDWSLAIAALERHLNLFKSGEDIDPESGHPHLTSVVFHALSLLTFMDEQPDYDDRWKK